LGPVVSEKILKVSAMEKQKFSDIFFFSQIKTKNFKCSNRDQAKKIIQSLNVYCHVVQVNLAKSVIDFSSGPVAHVK
jgi:hypothetical protein